LKEGEYVMDYQFTTPHRFTPFIALPIVSFNGFRERGQKKTKSVKETQRRRRRLHEAKITAIIHPLLPALKRRGTTKTKLKCSFFLLLFNECRLISQKNVVSKVSAAAAP
jgi:hypothetical protein